MERDITHFASAKFQGGWSASDFGKYLNRENITMLVLKFDKLDPLVRVRLLLSVLALDDATRHSLQPELEVQISPQRHPRLLGSEIDLGSLIALRGIVSGWEGHACALDRRPHKVACDMRDYATVGRFSWAFLRSHCISHPCRSFLRGSNANPNTRSRSGEVGCFNAEADGNCQG